MNVAVASLPLGPSEFRLEEWREDAACRGKDVDQRWWFPEGYGRDQRSSARALRVCATCPVRTECLEYALALPEKHGVWGGMTEGERRQELRRRERVAASGVG